MNLTLINRNFVGLIEGHNELLTLVLQNTSASPGRQQPVGAPSQYSTVAGSSPSQSKHRNQPMNAQASATTNGCFLFLSPPPLPLSLKSIKKEKRREEEIFIGNLTHPCGGC